VIDKGMLVNYQIVTLSTINASPRDPFEQPGAYEEAVLNTPILEEFDTPDRFTGIDIFRALRSFDPCMPCTTQVHTDRHVLTREINTCACGSGAPTSWAARRSTRPPVPRSPPSSAWRRLSSMHNDLTERNEEAYWYREPRQSRRGGSYERATGPASRTSIG
jgi:hypothetical protein